MLLSPEGETVEVWEPSKSNALGIGQEKYLHFFSVLEG
jgi:hypothetical protein